METTKIVDAGGFLKLAEVRPIVSEAPVTSRIETTITAAISSNSVNPAVARTRLASEKENKPDRR